MYLGIAGIRGYGWDFFFSVPMYDHLMNKTWLRTHHKTRLARKHNKNTVQLKTSEYTGSLSRSPDCNHVRVHFQSVLMRSSPLWSQIQQCNHKLKTSSYLYLLITLFRDTSKYSKLSSMHIGKGFFFFIRRDS